MSDTDNPILVGSIIHLMNGAPDGGHLDMRGWVTDKSVIEYFYDPHVQGLVSTHQTADRSMGLGSWMVLSAEGKPEGTPLVMGARVYLLNMYTGAGYLDSFEWVSNLEPFRDYPMSNGVFTSNVPNRGGGPTGTWIIMSATGKQSGVPFMAGDTVYLENGFSRAGYLQTYGKVTDHALFKEYEGQKLFVFTGPITNTEQSSAKWIVTLDNFVENLYHVQNQWGDSSAPWHEGGIFKIGDRPRLPVIKLSFHSSDDGNTLTGEVTYKGKTAIEFAAARVRQNIYTVKTRQDDASDTLGSDGEWRLGFRDSQNITAMDVATDPDSRFLTGTITYSGECPIRFKGVRQLEIQHDVSKIYYDFFHYELLKGRTNKLEGVIDTTYRLLSDSFGEITGISLEEALHVVYGSDTGSTTNYDASLGQLLQKAKSNQNQGSFDDIDYDFQVKQLLNLHSLSKTLNTFFRETLQELMKRSSEKHRLDRTLMPMYQIREGFRHTGNDHEIIQQATIQRRWNKQANNKYCMSQQAVELLVMDKLAIKAVAPFQHLLPGHSDRLAIVTFLSDKTHIHHVPYTDQFILVGISYDRVPPADSLFDDQPYIGKNFYASELMAIPHEVGHYIYDHGTLKNGETFAEVSRKFENNPYYRWCEEIFADLYGCIVAGPLSALGLQALLVSTDKNRAWKDDEDHPTPLLRIFILADMMRAIEEIVFKETRFKRYAFPKMTHKLDEDWTRVLAQWGYERMAGDNGRPHRIYLPDSDAVHLDRVVNIKRVVETVRPIIIEFAVRLIRELSEEHLAQIPWVRQDYEATEPYNQEMVKLTGRQFARQPVSQKALFDVKTREAEIEGSSPGEQLQWYLDNWDDRGPHVTGGHD